MTGAFDGPSPLLVGRELRAAESGRTFENIDPTTEEVLGLAADGTLRDADAAMAAARVAFDDTGWADDLEFRLHCLVQLKAALEKNVEELRTILVKEAGCPISFTRSVQLDGALGEIDLAIDLARSYEWERPLVAVGDRLSTIRREPRGVMAAITPFNYPAYLDLRKIAPALAAGCTTILKPSPETPWCAAYIAKMAFEHTDLPPGVLNVLTSSDTEVAASLTSDPRVDMVSFVGSTATGRRIMHQAADTLKKLVLELGGKSASIILDDADVAKAAAVAAGVGLHAGQGCGRLTRFIVPRSRYAEAVDAARDAFARIPVGDPADEATVQGPQVSAHQHRRVLGLIETAKSEGATVAFGGSGRPPGIERGYFVEPTLFTDVDPDSTIAQTEVFGPVAVMIPFDTDDEAVAIANNSSYGLSGAVTSGDPKRAMAVARRVRTGHLIVNGAVPGLDTPFGGWKQSGIGVDSGLMGFEEHLAVKNIGTPA
ncbi:aldehyde dehydrogenase family protein [Pseudonocardia xishanensis]|uniref:Aldehyde dehydrogenase n=1 Tax=Pseudonocardia xishanensis TaxID=630995 RepID=A0ABP8RU35_9PSEU